MEKDETEPGARSWDLDLGLPGGSIFQTRVSPSIMMACSVVV